MSTLGGASQQLLGVGGGVRHGGFGPMAYQGGAGSFLFDGCQPRSFDGDGFGQRGSAFHSGGYEQRVGSSIGSGWNDYRYGGRGGSGIVGAGGRFIGDVGHYERGLDGVFGGADPRSDQVELARLRHDLEIQRRLCGELQMQVSALQSANIQLVSERQQFFFANSDLQRLLGERQTFTRY